MTGSIMGRGNHAVHTVGHTVGTYRFCTVNCRPTASNYQLSHLRSGQDTNSDLRGGRQECYHSANVAPKNIYKFELKNL